MHWFDSAMLKHTNNTFIFLGINYDKMLIHFVATLVHSVPEKFKFVSLILVLVNCLFNSLRDC